MLAATGTTSPAAAGPKQVGGLRALAVSVPPDPVPIKAGSRARTLIRVVNPNGVLVRVTISSRALSLGDNGKVSVGVGPDPRWDSSVDFPKGEVAIAAQGYVDVPLTIQVPAHLSPDLYFVGFLVTPISTSAGSLQVINQIGSFVTVDVPGPRVRSLDGIFHLPSLALSSHAHGTVRIANTGRSASLLGGAGQPPHQERRRPNSASIPPSCPPAGTASSTSARDPPGRSGWSR